MKKKTRREMLKIMGLTSASLLLAACNPQTVTTTVPKATDAAKPTETAPKPSATVPEPTATAPEPSATAPKPPAEVTEVLFFGFGEAPLDFDTVLEKVNKKMADEVGLKIKYQFTSFSDYGNMLVLKASAGEEFDGFLDAPWLKMPKMIADEAIIVQDDLIKNAPNLLASIPQAMWNANRFNGKIYGIPLGVTQGGFGGFAVRKDLREKLGLPELKKLEDIEAYMLAAVKADTNLIGYNQGTAWSFANFGSMFKVVPMPVIQTFQFEYFWRFDPATKKVLPVWGEPDWKETAKKFAQFRKDGVFKDFPSGMDQTTLRDQGMFATWAADSTGNNTVGTKPLLKNVPEAKVEFVYPFEVADPKPWSDFTQWNFLCISRTSKHPEKVIAVMDWLSIQENHDLMQYGIEGTHWKRVGNDQYEIPTGNNYSFPGYELTWRPPLERTLTDIDPVEKQWFDRAKDANNFTPSPLIGLTWDQTKVKTEIASVDPLYKEWMANFYYGLFDVDEKFPAMEEAYKKAGYDTILQNAQEQVDAFLATKK